MSHDELHGRRSSESLTQAIARYSAAADDYATNPRQTGSEQELQAAQLGLRTALGAYPDGAALLTGDGIILVASEAFEERGFGRAGEPPPDPLRDIVIEPPRSEPRIVAVSMDTSKGRATFVARIGRVGHGNVLLALSQD